MKGVHDQKTPFYPHLKIQSVDKGDVKCGFDAQKSSLLYDKVRYTLAVEYDMPKIVTEVIPDNYYEITDVELKKEGEAGSEKAYLVLSGTYTGYEKEAFEALLTAMRFDLQNNPNAEGNVHDGRADWTVYLGFPHTATVEEGTWTFKIEVTSGLKEIKDNNQAALTWTAGTYTLHFGEKKKDDGSDADTAGDVKVLEAEDGQNITVGEITYTLVNKFGSGKDTEYWGCIGLRITDPKVVVKTSAIDYSTVKLENKDGKPILTIGGTQENCEAADFAFDVQGAKTDVLAATVDLETPGKFTLTVDLSSVGQGEYYMHLTIAKVKHNVASKETDYGTKIGDFSIGSKSYVIEKQNISWGPCVYRLIVTDSNGPQITWGVAKLEKDETAKKVYLVYTITAYSNCTFDDLKTIVYHDRDNEANGPCSMPVVAEKCTEADGVVTLYFDLTALSNSNEWRRSHLKMNDTDLPDPKFTDVQTGGDMNKFSYEGKYYELGNEDGRPYIIVNVAA